MKMGTKIATIGEKDIILPFKAIGAEVFPVSNPEQAREVLNKLLKEDFGIILVPDDLLPHIKDFLSQIEGTPLPCILPIPDSKMYGPKGSRDTPWRVPTKFGVNKMRELVKKAVGVDIMK